MKGCVQYAVVGEDPVGGPGLDFQIFSFKTRNCEAFTDGSPLACEFLLTVRPWAIRSKPNTKHANLQQEKEKQLAIFVKNPHNGVDEISNQQLAPRSGHRSLTRNHHDITLGIPFRKDVIVVRSHSTASYLHFAEWRGGGIINYRLFGRFGDHR
ncbi:hypothetical protein CEXT_406171 [Caerostris extrusa]|uniref:Uncharacterized protein n=1 Tax=Caerostris extrusa TaxID=172846 RepID=A0AAV4MF60_CAEEX|nr:hypothetical protein CEXT_406171 [Caerostris extrusa]